MTDHLHDHLTPEPERSRPMNYSTGKLVRSRERIIAGVCGGIANAARIDVGLVRIAAAVLALVTSGLAVVVYLVAWAVLPVEGERSTMLDSLIEQGKKQYGDYRSRQGSPTGQGQTGQGQTGQGQTGQGQTGQGETFNPYDEG